MSEREVDFLASHENAISSLFRMSCIVLTVTNVSGGSFSGDWSAHILGRRDLNAPQLSKVRLDPCLSFGIVMVLPELVIWR
jgi:hypothetical protein